jgi:hypothetical protein
MGKLGREIARDEAATEAKIAGASQRLLGQEESDGNNSERILPFCVWSFSLPCACCPTAVPQTPRDHTVNHSQEQKR